MSFAVAATITSLAFITILVIVPALVIYESRKDGQSRDRQIDG
jgi:hypothetical protein